jgi:hypothetical protein
MVLAYPEVEDEVLVFDIAKGAAARGSRGNQAGLVTATIDKPRAARQIRCYCDDILPLRRRFGSEGPQRGLRDEVSLQIECVVDSDMDADEALGRSR